MSRATLIDVQLLHRRVHTLAQYLCASFHVTAGALDASALAELEDVSGRPQSFIKTMLNHPGMLDGGVAH